MKSISHCEIHGALKEAQKSFLFVPVAYLVVGEHRSTYGQRATENRFTKVGLVYLTRVCSLAYIKGEDLLFYLENYC